MSKKKQLYSHYLNSRLLILRNIRPRLLPDIAILAVFLIGFFFVVSRETAIQAVLPWAAVWILLLATFFSVPASLVYWFFNRHPILRGLVLGIGCYVCVVLLGHAIDLKNFSAVKELLTLTGGAPFSAVHGVALIGAAYFYRIETKYANSQGEDPKEIVIRGPRIIKHQKAEELAREDVKSDAERTIEWGCLKIPISRGGENFLLVGNSGSGKTISLTRFLKSLLVHIRPEANKRLLVYDAKRDIYPLLCALVHEGTPIKILNPFDVRSYGWDIARDLQSVIKIDKDKVLKEDNHNLSIELATIMLPNHNGSHPFFPKAGQSLLGGIIEGLQFLTEKNEGDRWTLRDVILAMRTQARMRVVLEESHQTLKHLAELYIGNTEQDKGVSATIENELRRISYVAGAWEQSRKEKRMISLKEWLKEESIVVLGSDPESETTIKQINDIMFKRLVQLVRLQDEAHTEKVPRQTWFLVDELRHSGRLPGLEVLLTFGRSKGACTALAIQDIPGLAHNYNPDQLLSQELLGACENKGFLRTTDAQTQEFASKQFGEQEVDIPRHGSSGGVSVGPGGKTVNSGWSFSYQRMTQRLILPSQFASDLPRPDKSKKIGIRGYYQTTLVHHPYFAEITSEQITNEMVTPKEGVATFEGRPQAHFILEDWTMEDLERLNLTKHWEKLLVPNLKPSDAATATPPQTWSPWRNTSRATKPPS